MYRTMSRILFLGTEKFPFPPPFFFSGLDLGGSSRIRFFFMCIFFLPKVFENFFNAAWYVFLFFPLPQPDGKDVGWSAGISVRRPRP